MTCQRFKLCFFVLFVWISPGRTIKVLRSTLTLAQDAKAISGAKLVDERRVELTDITLCIRFNFKLLGGYEGRSQLIHIADWNEEATDSGFSLLWFGAFFPFSFINFGNPRSEGSYKGYLLKDPDRADFEVWETNRWSHVCLSYRKEDGYIRIVKDGKLLNINFADPDLTEVVIPDDFLSKIYLARCEYDYKATCSAPEGMIADFNVFGRALTEDEAKDWTTCRLPLKGDFVNWDQASFELENMTVEEYTMESLCVPARPGNVIFPTYRNFTQQMSLCSKLRGVMTVVYDAETEKELIDQIKQYPQCTYEPGLIGSYWTGWWDEASEGNYVNANTDEPLTEDMYSPWFVGEPNGDTLENCAIGWPNLGATWNDDLCYNLHCGFCELEKAPDILIRGLCDESKFDTRYSWTREIENDHHSFRGFHDTMLKYDPTSDEWRLELYSTEDTFATTVAEDYPFGNHLWMIINDPCYSHNKTYVELNINACNSTEFNCNDGQCISINERCDGKTQCLDKSDEIECQIFERDASYLKEASPPPLNGSKAEVIVDLDILSILEIKEVENTITLQIEMSLTWTDSRLKMYNLKDDKDLNTLTEKVKTKIWIPQVVFYNTKSKMESMDDAKAFATVSRQGPFEFSPRSQVQNSLVFKGEQNPITISRVYDSEFLCEFDMGTYPFDSQECSVIITMPGNVHKFVRLSAGLIDYLGPVDLTQYFIKDVKFSNYLMQPDVNAVKVDIVFGRRVLSTLMNTYLPTSILCFVCFSTNHFKSFYFEAIVTVNLTSLLVLTTLFISVFNSLPTTAYIKMIDIWMIVNLFVPFAEVIVHTMVDDLRRDGDEKQDNSRHNRVRSVRKTEIRELRNKEREPTSPIYKTRRDVLVGRLTRLISVGIPLLYILFVIVYFIIGFSIRDSESLLH